MNLNEDFTICSHCEDPIDNCKCVCTYCGETVHCECACGDAATGG